MAVGSSLEDVYSAARTRRCHLAPHLQILWARIRSWKWFRAAFPLQAFWSIVAARASSDVNPYMRACYRSEIKARRRKHAAAGRGWPLFGEGPAIGLKALAMRNELGSQF